MHPTEMLVRRLRADTNLNDEDVEAVKCLPVHTQNVPADAPIVREGDRPSHCCLMLKGFACRSKISTTGKRQILSFHIGGDIPDLQSLFLKTMDHDLATISPATLGMIEHAALNSLIAARPTVARAFWRQTLIDAAIFREWIVNIGVRPAAARMAHLLSEVRARMAAVGLANGGEFEFPITQVELSEALGLSPVHVNRVLQQFRRKGILDLQKNRVRIADYEKIVLEGGFEDRYLHLTRRMPSS